MGLVSITCGGDNLTLPAEGAPAAIHILQGDAQVGPVAQPLPDPLIVRVTDTESRPVVGQTVEFVPAAGQVTPNSVVTDADGRASASWVLGTAAGAQNVEARAAGGLIARFSANAVAGPPATIAMVSGNNQSGTAGTILAESLVVVVTDQFGNGVPAVAVDWSASGGTVSAPSVPSGSDGRSAVRWVLGPTAGPQAAAATAGSLAGSPVAFSANATVGAAGTLTISIQPSGSAQSGQAFAQQPAVQLRDLNGNPVAQPGVAVTAAIATGAPGSALIGSSTAATDANGLASFSGLGISGPAGTYTLNFSGANLTGVSSSPITIAAGAAAKLTLKTQPSSNVSSGTPFPQQPEVQVTDAAGNPVNAGGVAVTASIASGAGTLGGTMTRSTGGNGVASFTDLVITGVPGTRTLIFAASGLTSVTANPITVTAGGVSPTQSSVSAAPGSFTAGSGSSTITVTARDATGNPISGAVVVISVSGSGNNVTSPAPTGSNGVTTATLTSTKAESKTVSATINGTAIAQTATVTVTAGSPSTITKVSGDNQSGTVNTSLAPYVVLLTDAVGNPISGATVNWSASAGSITPSSVTDASGQASAVHTLGTQAGTQTAQASASGLSGSPVTFTATATAGPANAGQSTANVPSGTVNVPTTITVQSRDVFGNNLTTGGATVQVTVTGANPSGPITATDNGDGTYTATYTPAVAGTDDIAITLNGNPIGGSPYQSQVS